ncbi:hypothetical protein [Klebsiella pasteurii]|uniref:hypothetical protein n=1 Tax=Klebsiella pasteurii TaxID=2587529 RepID=UPI0035CF1E38
MKISNINSPRYANADNTAITVNMDIDNIGEDIPFTATPDDSTDYGPDIYKRALAGEYGDIAAYIAPI